MLSKYETEQLEKMLAEGKYKDAKEREELLTLLMHDRFITPQNKGVEQGC
jgi:hypothetical protein